MRSRKCRTVEEYLKRVHGEWHCPPIPVSRTNPFMPYTLAETWVADGYKATDIQRSKSGRKVVAPLVIVKESELIHRSKDWSQCETCCVCAPDEVKNLDDSARTVRFEFVQSEMPGWVTRSMEPPLAGDPKPEQLTKWHFCPNCGQEVKDHRPGTKQFCMTCGNSL